MRNVFLCTFVALFCNLANGQLPYLTTAYMDDIATPAYLGVKAMSRMGDVNGDGAEDYAVSFIHSMPLAGMPGGEVKVFSGSDNSLIHHLVSSVPFEQFGTSLAAGGDINNDGYDDILVGAIRSLSAPFSNGRVIAYSGLDGSVLHVVFGLANFSDFGSTIAGLGDVNGDGYADFVAGAPGYFGQQTLNGGLQSVHGYAKVISGIDGTSLFTFFGANGSQAGKDVRNVGDVNGDGINDLSISEPTFGFPNQPYYGRIRIRSGADGTVLHALLGSATAYATFWQIRRVGDYDGDGFDDFAIGERKFINPVTNVRGRIQVYSGATGNLLKAFEGAILATILNATIFATTFSFLPDMTGDGVPDFCAVDGEQHNSYGRIYSGATGAVVKTFPPPTGGKVHNMLSVGDQNSDGKPDFAVLSTPFQGQAASSSPIAFHEPEVRVYSSGTRPVSHFVSSSGITPSLSLYWTPTSGHVHHVSGTLKCSGATPGALGVVLVSLASADIPIFGTDLLVAVDSTNLILSATISAGSDGKFAVADIVRRIPELAGLSLYVQMYEVSPTIRASRATRFIVIP